MGHLTWEGASNTDIFAQTGIGSMAQQPAPVEHDESRAMWNWVCFLLLSLILHNLRDTVDANE